MIPHFGCSVAILLTVSTYCWAVQDHDPFSHSPYVRSPTFTRSRSILLAKKNSTSKSPLDIRTKNCKLERISNDNLKLIVNLRGGGGQLNEFFRDHPYAAAFSVCSLKAAAADSFAQKCERSRNPEKTSFQFKRNLAFIIYGGFYQGCFTEYLYNELFSKFFGFDNSLTTALKKVSFDTVVISPFLCLPIAYLIKAVVFQQALRNGLQRYIYDVMNNGLLTKKTLFWTPINAITFTIVPEHFRIAFVSCFSFFWLIMMSSIAGKNS